MSLFGSLRNRLLAGLGLLLLLFLALVGAGIGSLRSVNAAVQDELGSLARSAGLATRLVGSVSDEVRVGEGYLVVPSPEAAREFIRLSDSTHSFRRRFQLIPGLTTADHSALNRIESNQARMEVAYATAHALRDLGRIDEARAQADSARAPADRVVADVRQLTQRQQLRVTASIGSVGRRARQREVVIWLLLLTAIIFGAGTAFITIRSVEVPLYQLITAARRFGEGDLRPLELGAMPRELASLSRAMGSMGLKLRNVIDNLIRESRGIGVHASDLSAMSEELAAGSQEITGAIGAVTASAQRQVTEVRNADPVISDWREDAARDATSAERVVAEGEQTRVLAQRHHEDLSGAGRALAGLRQSVRLAGSQARDLARRAAAAEELLDLARQLVAQSEVLALNAAVEAARAGSHSQGFTAVAEETRRLADASRAAAERIGQGTEALREDLATLESTLQGIATEALRIESTTQRSIVALAEITRATETMRANAAEVSASVAGSRVIATRLADLRARLEADARENVTATEAVTAAAAEQSAATGEIATAAASLLEASERLAALVADFKV